MKTKTARAVLPNVGIEVEYNKRLNKLIDEMNRSLLYWLRIAYKNNPPVLAEDATPSIQLRRRLRRLFRRWEDRFNQAAPELAEYFSKSVAERSADNLKAILRRGGFSVKFQPTSAIKDVMAATVATNVSLIKSIPQELHTQVEGAVMRSVQTGRDLATLTNELQYHFGVTRRRAKFIAIDQNNKATSAFLRVRQQEAGIDEAVWMHSHAGKEPRPTHVAMDGKKYKISEGMYDSHEKKNVWPGELIRCRCSSKPVIPGFS